MFFLSVVDAHRASSSYPNQSLFIVTTRCRATNLSSFKNKPRKRSHQTESCLSLDQEAVNCARMTTTPTRYVCTKNAPCLGHFKYMFSLTGVSWRTIGSWFAAFDRFITTSSAQSSTEESRLKSPLKLSKNSPKLSIFLNQTRFCFYRIPLHFSKTRVKQPFKTV